MRTSFFIFAALTLLAVPLRAQDNDQITLQLPNNTVGEVLDIYQNLTGKRIIKDASLTGGPNISVVGPSSMPKSEAIRLIESALLLNNYSLVPAPDNSVKAFNSNSKNARSEGVPLYATAATLPAGEQVVSYFMALRHLSSQEALQIFQMHMVPHSYGVVVPVANAQALLITENTSVIRQLIALQALIDMPAARIASEFVELERADAERVAETIIKMLDGRKAGNAGQNPPGSPPANAGPESTMTERSLVAGDPQLVPDARTNRILIVARPTSMEYLKNLIKQFDQAANLMEPLEYPLRYAKASEVLPALQNLLAENKDQGAGGANPSVSNPNNARPASSIGDSGSGGSGSKGASSRLQAPTDDTAPESVIVGKTKLIADKKANSILVLGPPESKERVRTMLALLDKRPQQVHLATVIGQLTLGDGSEFGVDLLKKFGKIDSGGLAAGQRTRTAAGETVPEPTSLVTSTLIPLISGMTIYGAIGSQLDIYVKALESSNRFKVLSRPSVYTANNKKATITSGTQVPVPTSTISSLNTGTTDNTALNSTIEFKDVLLKLEVVPQINAEKEVSLNIYQSNDSVNGSTSISGNSVPIISTQELETTITVRNRQTVILGGLVTDGKEQLVSGTPWISRIPLLGMLFKDTRKTNNRTELIVLIEPTVIETQEEEQILKKQESNRLVVGADSENYAKPPIKPPVDQTKRLFFMPRNEKAVP